MTRRICLLLTLVLIWIAVSKNGYPAETPLDAKTMKIALHTATPEEEGFIEYVLARVEKGKLPLDLVQSTFLWAKQKPRHKFQYFKRGLIYRTEKLGIRL